MYTYHANAYGWCKTHLMIDKNSTFHLSPDFRVLHMLPLLLCFAVCAVVSGLRLTFCQVIRIHTGRCWPWPLWYCIQWIYMIENTLFCASEIYLWLTRLLLVHYPLISITNVSSEPSNPLSQFPWCLFAATVRLAIIHCHCIQLPSQVTLIVRYPPQWGTSHWYTHKHIHYTASKTPRLILSSWTHL